MANWWAELQNGFYRSGKYQSSVLELLPEKVSLKIVNFRGF